MQVPRLGIKRYYLIFIIPSVVTIAIFVISSFLVFLPRIRAGVIEQKKESIRNLVDLPLRIAAWHHRQVEAGKFDKREAQQRAAELIEALRYGPEDKDYFWILDTKPVLIMHPYREDLEGEEVGAYKDRHGTPVFGEMVEQVEREGEGFLTYYWQVRDEEETGRKLSYVSYFAPWDWIIGTGMYLGEIEAQLARLTRSVAYLSLGAVLGIAVLLVFMTRQGISLQKGKANVAAELARSKYYYRQLVELMEEGVLVQDAEGRITYVNRQFCSMLGREEREIMGRRVDEFMAQQSVATFQRELEKHRSGRATVYKAEWLTRSGSRLVTIVSPRILYDSNRAYNGSFAVITNITELKHTEEELTSLLQEKTILLKEIHHRVKNNLQVIASLFNLQYQNTTDRAIRTMLHESQLRIQTISRVHEFLYESENLRDIDMQRFLEELVLDIQAVYYEPRVAEINFEIAAEPLALPVDRAVPVGLIMNELVTNAIKHAFPPDLPTNGEKRITLFLRKEASGVSFGISDNGIGIPQEILTRQSLTLGFELIKVLTQQLQGEISVRPGEAGRGSRVEVSLSA